MSELPPPIPSTSPHRSFWQRHTVAIVVVGTLVGGLLAVIIGSAAGVGGDNDQPTPVDVGATAARQTWDAFTPTQRADICRQVRDIGTESFMDLTLESSPELAAYRDDFEALLVSNCLD